MLAKLGKLSKMFTPKQKQKRSPKRSPNRSPKRSPNRNSIFLHKVLLHNLSTSSAASNAASNHSEVGVPIHPTTRLTFAFLNTPGRSALQTRQRKYLQKQLILNSTDLFNFLAQQQAKIDSEERSRRNRRKQEYQTIGIKSMNMNPKQSHYPPRNTNNFIRLYANTSTKRSSRAKEHAQRLSTLSTLLQKKNLVRA